MLISVTFDVLKLLKSKLVKEEHFQNIAFILVTFDVLKLLISKLVKDVHPENILTKDVACDVLKLLKSIRDNFEQLPNIALKLATLVVLRFDTSILFKDEHP